MPDKEPTRNGALRDRGGTHPMRPGEMVSGTASHPCLYQPSHWRKRQVVVEVPDEAVLMSENSPIAELLAGESLTKETAIDDVYEVMHPGHACGS